VSAGAKRAWRVGIDIGGTFTDGVLWNSETGAQFTAKVLSTPSDMSEGFVDVFRALFAQDGARVDEVEYLAHGTTAATNAVLEGKLASVALVSTKGFRDVLEIARQVRPDPYDVFTQKPKPLVPRNWCLEIDERLTAEGSVLRALALDEVPALAQRLDDPSIDAVAVCLLHAYANPEHERRLGEELEKHLPGVSITLSSQIAPEFREYPRACTTVINAGLMPTIHEYLRRVEARLQDEGVTGTRFVMQSNGGLLSFAQAREEPVKLLESGAAAGLVSASKVSEALRKSMLISFDMGGTTAKMGLVRDGVVEMVPELEVGAANRSRSWFTGASGYPVLTPSVDLVEIGAGGGSIAWVDDGGKLRVGPVSAGAAPGPACYGRGGTRATVTDANVVLGRMNPHGLLGGHLPVDGDAAWAAVAEIADAVGLETTDAALGIVEIACAAMARAARTISVERGYDPRDFALVAFGGAGPLHAAQVAEEMGICEIVVQPKPGIASAIGLLQSDLRYELSRTWIRPSATAPRPELEAIFGELEQAARQMFAAEMGDIRELRLVRSLEMRYIGQSYQLQVAFRDGAVGDEAVDVAAAEFHRTHRMRYGHAETSEPVEIVNVRLTAIGLLGDANAAGSGVTGDGEPVARRNVRFDRGVAVETPIFDRSTLPLGWRLEGPAVVEGDDSTILVPPAWNVGLGDGGNLVLTRN